MNINEFAQQIGVSRATVSRAVLGTGRINPQTREMILKRARELGYTPNANGRRLVTGRSMLVALDLAEMSVKPEINIEDTFGIEIERAIVHSLHDRGYDLVIHSRQNDDSEDRLRQLAHSRAVDGIILSSPQYISEELMRNVPRADLPCVVIDILPRPFNPYLGSVVMDLAPGVEEMVELLVRNGHRRIAYIGRFRPPNGEDFVFDCFLRSLERHGLSLLPELCIVTQGQSQEGQVAMNAFLSLPEPPTAVFARKDSLALGALYAALDRGMRVPQDISLVGYDDSLLARLAHPLLTTIKVNTWEIGEAAVELLFGMLEGGTERQVTLATRLVERQTVGPARH